MEKTVVQETEEEGARAKVFRHRVENSQNAEERSKFGELPVECS